jgi:hypothetical protein
MPDMPDIPDIAEAPEKFLEVREDPTGDEEGCRYGDREPDATGGWAGAGANDNDSTRFGWTDVESWTFGDEGSGIENVRVAFGAISLVGVPFRAVMGVWRLSDLSFCCRMFVLRGGSGGGVIVCGTISCTFSCTTSSLAGEPPKNPVKRFIEVLSKIDEALRLDVLAMIIQHTHTRTPNDNNK